MKIEEIKKQYDTIGTFNVKVIDRKYMFEERYAENGMFGRVTYVDYRADQDEEGYIVFIDWKPYKEHNEALEAKDWSIYENNKLVGTGTMKEAGYFPENGIEDFWFDVGKETGITLKS